jgi:hypothetical protein
MERWPRPAVIHSDTEKLGLRGAGGPAVFTNRCRRLDGVDSHGDRRDTDGKGRSRPRSRRGTMCHCRSVGRSAGAIKVAGKRSALRLALPTQRSGCISWG